MKPSPPMPVDCGSTTASTAAAAIAASMALPPAFRISIAATVASGWEVEAAASVTRNGDRPGLWKSRMMWLGSFVLRSELFRGGRGGAEQAVAHRLDMLAHHRFRLDGITLGNRDDIG